MFGYKLYLEINERNFYKMKVISFIARRIL